MNKNTLEIVGAGPSGLSAALVASAQGAAVTVYEKRPEVGVRFHGDFQGLENWTSPTDVLAELENCGIQPSFEHTPVYEIVCFDANGIEHHAKASAPIFYLVRRGAEPGTVDQALKTQALTAGIDIRFNQRQRTLPGGGIVAEGPHRADAIAAGYVFETDMADGCYVAVAKRLAPSGYSYLLIHQGRGTVATCLFEDFHRERHYLEETVAFFKDKVGLHWQTAKPFGGSGNFDRVRHAAIGNRLYCGEAAGFQDALFGFGLRYAFLSGHMAGRAKGSASVYEQAWQSRLSALNSSSLFNRWFYTRLGDRGRNFVIRNSVARGDPRHMLSRIYAPAWWKSLSARWLPGPGKLTNKHLHEGCDCTWCRCHRENRAHSSEH